MSASSRFKTQLRVTRVVVTWAIFVVRWLDGSHWDGKPQTNAGFKRKGSGKGLTQTGYARPFYYRPKWQRILIRWAETFLPLPIIIAIVYGLFDDRGLTEGTTISALALVAAAIGVRVYKYVKRRTHHRDALMPLHKRLGPLADIPPGASPDSWIDVSKDHSEATLTLPDTFRENDAAQASFAKRAAEALGMEEPEIFWKLHRKDGNDPELKLVNSPAPPPYVSLSDVIGFIKNGTSDIFTLGLGRRSLPVDVSLDTDSPNIGASMGAGAGKSTMARFMAAQALYKGCIVVFIDTKRVSHVWARGLPNVIYADTPELVHEVLLWLDEELERRNEVAVFGAIAERSGAVPADVGPRLFIVAEELNLTANKLRTYWTRDLEGKGKSPAEIALQNLAFAGRQVRMNYLVIAQMLTARVLGGASGGGEARENIGVRLLSRYSKKNGEMLVPEMDMPPVSPVKGRTQVAALGKLRVVQIADISEEEATRLSLEGVVAPLPSTLPALLKSSPSQGF